MKTLKLFLFATILLTGIHSYAQKEIKEGMIKFKVSMSSDNEQLNASLASLGDMTATTYFKGQKSATSMDNPMSGKTSTIIDNDKKEMLLLLDSPMMGKIYQKSTFDAAKEKIKDVKITETGDFKTVLGYKCKGYNMKIDGEGNSSDLTMYVTDKIKAPHQQNWSLENQVKGYPLYMIIKSSQGGVHITSTMEATELKAEKVDDSKFDMSVPEGYTELPK